MSRFVIMTGTPRSVTSWRCHALNYSSDLFMFHECNLFGMDHSDKNSLISNKHKYIQQFANKLKNNILPDEKYMPFNNITSYESQQEWLEDHFKKDDLSSHSIKEFADDITGDYDIIADKVPGYIHVSEKLANKFDNVKFIVCLRHPYYVARSMLIPKEHCTEWWNKPDPDEAFQLAINEYKEVIKTIENIDNDRLHSWKAEDLRDEPKKSWSNVGKFLNIDLSKPLEFHRKDFKYSGYDDIDSAFSSVSDSLISEINDICDFFNYDKILTP